MTLSMKESIEEDILQDLVADRNLVENAVEGPEAVIGEDVGIGRNGNFGMVGRPVEE